MSSGCWPCAFRTPVQVGEILDGALWAKFWQGSTWGTVSPDVLTRLRSVCLPLCHHECPPNSLPDGMAVSSPDLWCPTQPAVFVPARQPVTRMVCSYSRSKTLRRMHTPSPQSFPRGSVLGHPRNSLLAPCTHVIATAWEAHECISECVHVQTYIHGTMTTLPSGNTVEPHKFCFTGASRAMES